MDNLSDSVVQLEIDDEWYWWSGYPRYPNSYDWRLAVTDGPAFYAEAAFPSLKPDIDIFGVPRRSRKQRGWHQVAASASSLNHVPTEPAPCRTCITPADIPPDLFEKILEHLKWHPNSDLVQYALVCRYWNIKCREALFCDPELRSREDAVHLLELMKIPTRGVSSYVGGVEVEEPQAVSDTPWIHLVAIIDDRRTQLQQPFTNISLKLEGPLPAGHRMRSIHHGLPRSLPGHFSCLIYRLSLTDIHFKKLDDLMHLVWEMPDLVKLYCERVTWESLPTALPRRKPRSESRNTLFSAKISQCGPRKVEASVWLVASARRRNQAFLSPNDITHVLSLARELENSAGTSVKTSNDWDTFRFKLEQHRHVWLQYQQNFQPPSSYREWCLGAVIFDNRKLQVPDSLAENELDWTIVDSVVSSFPVLRRVVIGLDSRENMIRFEEEVAKVHMPLLSSSGMLRYALWDPTGVDRDGYHYGTWLRASPHFDQTEPSGWREKELHDVYRHI